MAATGMAEPGGPVARAWLLCPDPALLHYPLEGHSPCACFTRSVQGRGGSKGEQREATASQAAGRVPSAHRRRPLPLALPHVPQQTLDWESRTEMVTSTQNRRGLGAWHRLPGGLGEKAPLLPSCCGVP